MRDQNLCVCRQRNVSLFTDPGTISRCLPLRKLFDLTPSSEASKGERGSWISSARAIPGELEDNNRATSKHNLLPATRSLAAASAPESCRLLSKEGFFFKKSRCEHPSPLSQRLFVCFLILTYEKLFQNTAARLGETELLSRGIPS